jgi:hypothetical protein
MKQATVGRAKKAERTKAGTPKFPVHPEGETNLPVKNS